MDKHVGLVNLLIEIALTDSKDGDFEDISNKVQEYIKSVIIAEKIDFDNENFLRALRNVVNHRNDLIKKYSKDFWIDFTFSYFKGVHKSFKQRVIGYMIMIAQKEWEGEKYFDKEKNKKNPFSDKESYLLNKTQEYFNLTDAEYLDGISSGLV